MEAALDAIVMMDHEGTITEFNHAAEETFGYSGAEAIGTPLVDLLIAPSLRDRHKEDLRRYLDTGQGTTGHASPHPIVMRGCLAQRSSLATAHVGSSPCGASGTRSMTRGAYSGSVGTSHRKSAVEAAAPRSSATMNPQGARFSTPAAEATGAR